MNELDFDWPDSLPFSLNQIKRKAKADTPERKQKRLKAAKRGAETRRANRAKSTALSTAPFIKPVFSPHEANCVFDKQAQRLYFGAVAAHGPKHLEVRSSEGIEIVERGQHIGLYRLDPRLFEVIWK